MRRNRKRQKPKKKMTKEKIKTKTLHRDIFVHNVWELLFSPQFGRDCILMDLRLSYLGPTGLTSHFLLQPNTQNIIFSLIFTPLFPSPKNHSKQMGESNQIPYLVKIFSILPLFTKYLVIYYYFEIQVCRVI